ncbi:hypothetical protein [Methylopila sp. M107]|uniref:hypothetical protein n=1 Tax=Methylopila sp. M107 TaxID=1101190 RepID=UPI000365B223|nr:hypothetical protein [Methylopila sp. M107]
MSDAAFVIEIKGRQAGIVVREKSGGYRFFAAVTEAFPIEGKVFRSAVHARRAAQAAVEAPRR